MERTNREEDEVATRPHHRSALPGLQAFNPRIRIIGVPTATLPAPLRQPIPDHQNWEDDDVAEVFAALAPAEASDAALSEAVVSEAVVSEAAVSEAAVSEAEVSEAVVSEAPVSPISVRAIMDVGAALPVPSAWDAEEPAPPTAPPVSSDPPTTKKPGAPAERESAPVDRGSAPRDRDSDSGIRRARSSEGSVVTSAPELPLSYLSWDEREKTDVIARPEESRPEASPLVWEDDEVTMPRRNDALRAQARLLATTNAAREAALERAGVRSRLAAALAEAGPHGTLVDSVVGDSERDRASEAKTLVGRGDTLVDAEPPSEILRDSEREEQSDEEEAAPHTQPSVPPPARSIEIDLADLDASQLTRPELPSLLFDGVEDEHTPVPAAFRSPSTPPLEAAPEGSSLSPVAIPESMPRTRVSPAPRRSRAAAFAIGAALTLCLGVIAFVLYPKTGSLVVRLSTPEADGVAKAEIFVDGQKRCDTDPCILRDLAPGQHVVKVVAPGRSSEATEVVVEPNEEAQVTVALPAKLAEAPAAKETPVVAPPKPGLAVEVATEGARVVIVEGTESRVLSGPFPLMLDLAPGRYKVVASRFGYAPFVQWVTVVDGEAKARIHVELEPSSSAPASETPSSERGEEDPPKAKAAANAPEAETGTGDTDADIYE